MNLEQKEKVIILGLITYAKAVFQEPMLVFAVSKKFSELIKSSDVEATLLNLTGRVASELDIDISRELEVGEFFRELATLYQKEKI